MSQTLPRVLLEAICIGVLVTYGYAHGGLETAAATLAGIGLVGLWISGWGVER